MKNLKRLLRPVISSILALMLLAYPVEAIALTTSMTLTNVPSQTSSPSVDVQSMDTETLYEGFYDAAQTLQQTLENELKGVEKNTDTIDGSLIACITNCSSASNSNGKRATTQLSIIGAFFGVMLYGLGHSFYSWKTNDSASALVTLFLSTMLRGMLMALYMLMPNDMMIVSTLVILAMVSSLVLYSLEPRQNALYAEKTLAHAPKVKVTLNGYTKEVTLAPHNYQGRTTGTVFRETGDSTGIFRGSLREIVPSEMVKLLAGNNKETMQAQIWIPRTQENGRPTAVPAERIVTIIPTKMLKMTPKQALELLKAGSKDENTVGWEVVSKKLSPRGQHSGNPLNGSVLIIPSELYNESEVALWKETAKKQGAQSGHAMKSSVLVIPGGKA